MRGGWEDGRREEKWKRGMTFFFLGRIGAIVQSRNQESDTPSKKA